ncbi:MAG: glycosyltransferase, partial [Candidatus Omnitrophica bacterium]|nr:glycosyltransferase [Candidatus Omnitrophota bacterium]
GFLDDDDEFYPEHVETLVTYMQINEVKICYSDYEILREEVDPRTNIAKVNREIPFFYDFNFSFLLFTNYIPIICLIFHKSICENIRFDESFEVYEDWDFLIRIGDSYSLTRLDKITAVYHRWSDEQITSYTLCKNRSKDRYYYAKIIKKYSEKYTPEVFYAINDIYNHISRRLLEEILSSTKEKKEFENKIASLTQQLASVREEKKEFENKIASLTQQLASVREEKNSLSTTLNRIYSSHGWRMLKKYYAIKEFITGTDNTLSINERFFIAIKSFLKKILPKKIQIYIKFLHYQLQNLYKKIPENPSKTNSKPFITIVIPVYNRSSFLKESIESALQQEYENFEIVAIDDFSSETETRNILTQFSNRPKINILFNDKNLGISETLNRAILNSKGDYIAFLDCDDKLPQKALSLVASFITQNSEKGYFFSDRINIDATGKEIEKITFINRKRDNYFRELMKGMFTDHLKVIKKDAFLEVGLLDSKYDSAQDYEFALRYAFKYPVGFCYINDYLYYHRVYPDQVSSSKAEHQKELTESIKEKARFKSSIKLGQFNKKISIVVLSFNKVEHTIRCIESIKNTIHCNYEIILFDNASNKETIDILHSTFSKDPRVKIIFSPKNLGCPRGRKKAITFADGDYVITLDNDIVVTDGWIEELITRVEEDKYIAGACCKVIFPDEKIQYNGGSFTVRDDFIEFSLIDAWKNAKELSTMRKVDCDWIPGGATLYKREIYEKIKICENYENAYEDNDFSLNVKKLGYKLVNCPTAKVIHNHIYYDKKSLLSEKEYLQSRYNNEALKRSVITFYKRNGLIIKDDYIFRIFGFTGLKDEEIKDRFILLTKS